MLGGLVTATEAVRSKSMDLERAIQLQDEIIEVRRPILNSPPWCEAYRAKAGELQRFGQRMKAGGAQALRAQEARERFLLELQMPIVARWGSRVCQTRAL